MEIHGGMILTGENRRSERKTYPIAGPPQIPHGLTWARTWASAVKFQLLTTWPWHGHYNVPFLPWLRYVSLFVVKQWVQLWNTLLHKRPTAAAVAREWYGFHGYHT
jgi:hypothetical protein